MFNPEETADNLKKYGEFRPLASVPAAPRPTTSTSVLTRLTTVGGIYLVAVCLLPEILISDAEFILFRRHLDCLIVVSVTMDTVTQIQSHLLAASIRRADSQGRVKGRR